MRGLLASWQRRIVDVRPEEVRALWFAFLFNFIVLASYYVIRPIRDDIGAAGGVENLSWMFSATLAGMLIANALFSAIVARMSRRKFIPLSYRFFILNLAAFYLLMRTASSTQAIWVGRGFYVWVSVFNLFVVTVFWAFMTDIFNSDQGKRLFGFISVGGTLGGILGGTLTASLVQKIGTANLLILSAILLEAGAWCVRFFPTGFRREDAKERKDAERPIGGNLWSGISHVFSSPYLLGICAFMLLHAITATLVYFQQADITAHEFHDRAARTAFFAQLDLSVNILTVLVQIFLTGRLLKWLGVGLTLAMLPLISLVGFAALAIMPVLSLLAFFQVLRRAMNYAVSRPAREVLFTVLRREDKYKAKSFMDTFVYRTGDQIGAWSYPALRWLGLGLTGISWVAVPLAAAWCVLSLWLGRRKAVLARQPIPRPSA
ncbi:MAG: MFS transporter [Chthoniobacterales bacterium]|nr:MFS transporter [Chthoniobacterales bacterium]